MSFLISCCLEILFPSTDADQNTSGKIGEKLEQLQPVQTLHVSTNTQPVLFQPAVILAPSTHAPQSYSQAVRITGKEPQIIADISDVTFKSEAKDRFKTADEIPDSLIKIHGVLLGAATKIIDGDTIRFYHKLNHEEETPKSINILRQETFAIRLAGIDCPETDHGDGKGAQPFGNEAALFLHNLLYQKSISIQILDRDQYGRIVARVLDSQARDCSTLLLENGLAYMYTGKGAVYGGQESIYLSALNSAKSKKIGVWSVSNLQTPSEYKRQYKN